MLNVELESRRAPGHSTFNIRHSTFNISRPFRVRASSFKQLANRGRRASSHSTFSDPLPIRFIAMQVTPRTMPATHHHQRRLPAVADVHDVGTAGVELAARGEVRDRWNHARD